MQVILTHEQADFDAIASLLGASLLQANAYAVVPKNLNRNVSSFVHLYDAELPFVSAEDLPDNKIEHVTLVDTQSLITLKGIYKETKIHVIDHHQKKDDFPENWNFQPLKTSACTTYFVEQLQENNGYLDLVHATLLLLGIYEDTGSLTYTNTTPRDILAAAYLLENGASLKIAAQFLNPPLSIDQREIFDLLIENMRSINMEECNIFISYADAPDLDNEVSSIAHKISDLYDPDGLFIFVKTREGIRLVARSTTEQINAGKIASDFGGGGHSKAAAALIKHNKQNPDQLKDIVSILKEDLKKYIEPAVTVKQIMSKKPLTIAPDTSAEEAYELMQRFGYEGYPVVENDKIIGLLIRRAVDRAISHELNLNASSLMEAGSFSVLPADSLEILQKVMADSGWGQVPVVEPGSGKVIGIVTRTDLLKTLAGRSTGSIDQINLADEMQKLLPPSRMALLNTISSVSDRLNLPIYLVGGFARDILLKQPSFDLDFVVEGDAIQLADALVDWFGGSITSHKKFGTAKWHISELKICDLGYEKKGMKSGSDVLPKFVDLISARTEYYNKPTALPTVKKSSIKMDLQRRDFTINTMAIRLDGAYFGYLYDYWGGLNDLKKKKIRVLHSLSFVDDPTRLLRAVRFEQRFGFSIEDRTLQLMREAKNLLLEVSGDRIRHEIDQILDEANVVEMFSRLNELKLLHHIHPSLIWSEKNKQDLATFFESNIPGEWRFPKNIDLSILKKWGAYITLFVRFQPKDLKTLVRRLRFSSKLRQMILNGNNLWQQKHSLIHLMPGEVTRLLEKYSQLVVYCVYLLEDNEKLKQLLKKFAVGWRWTKPHIDGDKLRDMGLDPGPIYRKTLEALRFAWIDGKISSKQEEKEYLKHLLEEKLRPS